MPPLPLCLCAAFLHVATSSFCPTGNMTKKVKLLPNTHTHTYSTQRQRLPLPLCLPPPLFRSYANAIMRHIPISPSQSPFSSLVSSFKTPPENDKRDQNWTNSCCYCCFSFCCCCCFCWDMQIGKWVRGECRPCPVSTRCRWPLTFSGHSRRVESRVPGNGSNYSISPIPVPVPVPIPIHIHIDVHVAIRQRFNRVCAFAWKSLKLNASDGNLYASPARRQREEKRKGGRQWEGRQSPQPESVPPTAEGCAEINMRRLFGGGGGKCGGAEERGQTFCQGIFPLALFAAFCFRPALAAAAAAAFASFPSQASSVDS